MSKKNELILSMVGDVRVDREDPLTAFQHVKDFLRQSEFIFGNLEGAHADKGTPWLREGSNWRSRSSQLASYVAVSAALFSGGALSQETSGAFPSKPVAIVVPQSPGGATDVEARIFAVKMTELMGQQVLVENRSGAGTTVGTVYVAKAKPDGYTVLAVTGGFTSYPAFYSDAPTVKDFAPVTLMSQRANVLVIPASFPVKNFSEYVAHAKANPSKINFGTSGSGAGVHLAGAWMHSAANIRATFIHYKGSGALMQDLVAGRLQATSLGMLVALPLLKSGKLRALAIMNDMRSNLLPDLATVAEQGIPGYNYSAWLGFAAPAGTPVAIVDKLAEGFVKVTKSPDVANRLEAAGSMMVGSSPEQFRQFLVNETAQWRKVVQENGIKME